jgi:hypothetical protein
VFWLVAKNIEGKFMCVYINYIILIPKLAKVSFGWLQLLDPLSTLQI